METYGSISDRRDGGLWEERKICSFGWRCGAVPLCGAVWRCEYLGIMVSNYDGLWESMDVIKDMQTEL